MTKAEIEAVPERVKTWPIERQEEAARMLLLMEATGTYELGHEEIAALSNVFDGERRDGIVRQEQVAAIVRRLN